MMHIEPDGARIILEFMFDGLTVIGIVVFLAVAIRVCHGLYKVVRKPVPKPRGL